MSSTSTQEQINKAKKSRDHRTATVFAGGIGYAIIAIFIPNESWISPVVLPLSLGIGIGLLMFGFSLTLEYETTKKLILMEDKLESKLDEISDKVATQTSIDVVQNKVDEHFFHIQILELKNELDKLKEEIGTIKG